MFLGSCNASTLDEHLRCVIPQSTYRGRGEIGGGYLHSQLERTHKLCSWWQIEWKGQGLHPPPSTGWADFTIMVECTPENGYCNSLCTLCISHSQHWFKKRIMHSHVFAQTKVVFSLHLRGLIPSSRTWSVISLSSVQKTCWLGSFFFSLHVLAIYCYDLMVFLPPPSTLK